MSVCIGASATGARTYTATASQGLLYMVEALYNASGLGLPIVMTVANRAIGSPINIWNDHSDAMSQRDSGWIQLYAESNQEALDLHVQAFRLAEELSLPVMVCMDGFVLTHAVERVDVPDAGAGRRVPAAVRAAPGPRPRRPDDDRRDGRARGVHRGPLPHARQADAGARRDPADRRRLRGGVRPRLRRPRARLPDRGRRDGRRRARLGAGHDRGRRRRAARRRASAIGALGDHAASGRGRSTRCARRWRGARARRRRREGVRRRRRRDRRPERAPRARGPAASRSTTSSPASAGGRSRAPRCTACSTTRSPAAWAPDLPGPRHATLVERELRRGAQRAAPARTPRTCCATSASSPEARPDALPADQVLPGRARSRSATGCSTPTQRTVQSDRERSNTLTSGPPRLPGLRRGARRALRAGRRDARQPTAGSIAANATGCLEVFSTPYPESSWQLPWIHSLFGNAPAVATGIAAALQGQGPRRRARHRPGRRRRHGRHRLRRAVGDVRAQRRRALHLLRQRGLHEHRRAALRRDAAGGAHRDDAGRRRPPRQRRSARARARR